MKVHKFISSFYKVISKKIYISYVAMLCFYVTKIKYFHCINKKKKKKKEKKFENSKYNYDYEFMIFHIEF